MMIFFLGDPRDDDDDCGLETSRDDDDLFPGDPRNDDYSWLDDSEDDRPDD